MPDLSAADDPDLVILARTGDRRALEVLLLRHHAKVLGLCRRLLADAADAEDAAQEALLAMCRGLDQFDGRSAFTTWLYRVTTNTCLDELRRRRRRPSTLSDDSRSVDGPAAEPRSGRGGDPAATVASRLDLEQALARVPLDFRVAVVLRDVCDLDYAEIARITGAPDGTVRSRIARGRAALARALAEPIDGDGNQRPSAGVEGTRHG